MHKAVSTLAGSLAALAVAVLIGLLAQHEPSETAVDLLIRFIFLAILIAIGPPLTAKWVRVYSSRDRMARIAAARRLQAVHDDLPGELARCGAHTAHRTEEE